jgi:hypothetical protein
MAVELFTVLYAGLYRPYDIAPAGAVVLTVIAIAGQLGLFVALAASLDLLDGSRLARRFKTRGRATHALS